MGTRRFFREKAEDFVRRNAEKYVKSLRPEEMTDPGRLLSFPTEYSYWPPTLIDFKNRGLTEPWVSVGKYSSINGGTRILLGGGHHPEWVSTYPFRIKYDLPGAYADDQPSTRGPVIIGNDVWVGYDVVIQSGVNIGDGAVVATGSLVVKDVAPYTIVGGNPAVAIRKRFDKATIDALLRISWWDWPHEKVLSKVDSLCGPDLTAFIAEHDPGE